MLSSARRWQRVVGGFSSAKAIALGAYGSHALSKATEKEKKQWEIANRYDMIHSFALCAAPAIAAGPRAANIAGLGFVGGIVLFSTSIYGKVYTKNDDLGKAAPFGGVSLMVGWLALALVRR